MGSAIAAALWLSGGLFSGACSGGERIEPRPFEYTPPASSDAGASEAGSTFPDTGIGSETLLVTRLAPDHGPFVGGNSALVRGAGFTDTALVFVGGRMVQEAATELVDPNRLRIVLPAGEPGPADVVVQIGDQEVTLVEGYTFDRIYIEPGRGSVSGGTEVEIIGSGTAFADGDAIYIGGGMCTDVVIVSETRIRCAVPSGGVGSVDVSVVRAADGSELTIEDGFTYYDSVDPFGGGLGGGPLMGDLNVAVIDGASGLPVADAFVIVGEDLSTEHQGSSSVLGQISFSGADLVGDQTVHVAKHCYEKTSVIAFDARDVTVFLIPWQDPSCGMGSGTPPAGRGVAGSFVSGELIFLGPNEVGPNPWDIIPDPRPDEIKVAYVYATQPCAANSIYCENPDPSLGGAQSRILDDEPGIRGYPYRIFVRPGAMAVYALAGVESTTTGEFVPYVMGVARNVLAGPGVEVPGADMIMNIPLDHYLDIRLDELPGSARTGPDRFMVRADLDLGGEGFIVREVNDSPMDVIRRRTNDRAFRLFAQPALLGALADGRYRIHSGWFTGDFDSPPSTESVLTGVRAADAEIVMGGFLGIPQAVSPAYGESIPADRILRWEADGPAPDLHMILMSGGDGNPAWRHFVRGDVYEAPIPDLSSIPEIDDISPGFISWWIYALRIPGLNFDEFSYSNLQERYWSHWASDYYTAVR